VCGSGLNIHRCTLTGWQLQNAGLSAPIDKIWTTASGANILVYSSGKASDIVTGGTIRPGSGTSGSQYMVNCEAGTWSVPSNATAILYRQYTYNLKVVDNTGTAISGATVTLNNVDGTEVFSGSTDASGDITEQELTYHEYHYDGAVITTARSPYALTITATGYPTLTKTFEIDEALTEVERLTPDGTNIQDTTLYDSTIY
jgi:hypothetical protein